MCRKPLSNLIVLPNIIHTLPGTHRRRHIHGHGAQYGGSNEYHFGLNFNYLMTLWLGLIFMGFISSFNFSYARYQDSSKTSKRKLTQTHRHTLVLVLVVVLRLGEQITPSLRSIRSCDLWVCVKLLFIVIDANDFDFVRNSSESSECHYYYLLFVEQFTSMVYGGMSYSVWVNQPDSFSAFPFILVLLSAVGQLSAKHGQKQKGNVMKFSFIRRHESFR